MRRATLLVLATIAVMLLATGVALAAVKYGTSGNDVIKGTSKPDAIYGKTGNDTLYGDSGDDNFKNTGGKDKYGNAITAGLRGGGGDDKVYGQKGDDDVIGHPGNDTLDDSSPSNLNDWDRAFGGTGNDSVNVADGDTEDEVSCGENTTSTTGSNDDTDTVKIDVQRDGSGQITAADTVYEYDANGNSTKCEEIKDQGGNVVTQNQLPQSAAVASAEEPS